MFDQEVTKRPVPLTGQPETEGTVASSPEGSLWWRLEGTTLRIGGRGIMKNQSNAHGYPWYAHRNMITAAVIEPGVENLGGHVFSGYPQLSRVMLPEGLCRLGVFAFANSALEEITIPQGVTCIESFLFTACSRLREVRIPDSLKEIRHCAFRDCLSLTRVNLPAGLKVIGDYAFMKTGVRKLDLPEGLLSIGMLAFDGMPLTELVIPGSVVEVEGRLVSRLSAFPIRLPEGKEDMPVLEPDSSEMRLHHLAYTLFHSREDVLSSPSGDPAADRYTALLRLLDFMESCYHKRTNYLSKSRASAGYVHFCCDEECEITNDCLDGGCGPIYSVTELGVGFHILSDEAFLQHCADSHPVQEAPFPIWKKNGNNNCLLDRPFGLTDRFLVDGSYPFTLPEPERTLSQEDQRRQDAADALFGDRGDIFVVPKGAPREDRFAALCLLIDLVETCTFYTSDSYLESCWKGKLRYILDEDEEVSSCYDGGGGNIDTYEDRVDISVLTPEELQKMKKDSGKEADPNGVLVLDRERWILEQPLGMKDSFLFEMSLGIHYSENYSEKISERFAAYSDETARLMRMGDVFFAGRTRFFTSPSGSFALDRFRAISQIRSFVKSSLTGSEDCRPDIAGVNDYAPSCAEISAGELKYCYALDETYCYDGGCCDTDVERRYLVIRIISDDELEQARENVQRSMENGRGQRPYLIRSFCERNPSETASDSSFADWNHLYLKHPYGTVFNLSIYVYTE